MPELFSELKGLEIFKAGTYYDTPYSKAELEEIVEATTALINDGKHRAPGKLGHDEAQEFAKANGMMAIGWVEKLWTDGKSIFADFKHIPRLAAEAIKAKLYDGVSCEIYSPQMSDQEFGIKKLVLRAVAFLGADVPKVKGMMPLSAALAMEEKELKFQAVAVSFSEGKLVLPFKENPTVGQLTPDEDAPEDEDTQTEKEDSTMATAAEDAVKLAEQNATKLAEQTEIANKAIAAREAVEMKALDKTIAAFFETHKEVILPAMHDRVKALVKSYKADSVVKLGEANVSAQDTLLALLGEIATAKKVSLDETEEGEEAEDVTDEVKKLEEDLNYDRREKAPVEGAELAIKAKKYAEEHGVPFREALRKVSVKEVK